MAKLHWDSFRWERLYEFNILVDYLRVVHRQLEEAKSLQLFNLEESFKSQSFETDEHYYEASSMHSAEVNFVRDQFESEFPRTLFYGALVQIYMLLEVSAIAICEEIRRRRASEIRFPTNGKGSLFERIHEFMTETLGNEASSKPASGGTADLQKLRNCIVHCCGKVEDSRDEPRLREITRCNIYPTLSLTSQGQIDIQLEGCLHFAKLAREFIDGLCDVGGFGPSDITVLP